MTENDDLRRRGYYLVTVRESSTGRDLGWSTDSEPPESDGRLGDYGSGSDLKGPGFDEIEAEVELEEIEPGTHVATLWIDLDEWTYEVEYVDGFGPDRGLLDRARELVGV